MKPERRLIEFVQLFNEREFFRAHEVLEELWLETHGELRDFYKGLIQCAVAFLHAERGNPIGALNVYERSRFYLTTYPDKYQQIKLEQLRIESENFFRDYKKDPEEIRIPPQIKFARSPD